MKETKRTKALISEYFIFVIFIALVVVLTCLKPSFIQPGNLVNILKQASINGILAFGMMFVIIAGGFDMSVGSTVAFTGVLAAMLGQGQYPLIVPLAVAMLAGLAVGVVNGVGVAVGDLPPFIMTLGTMTAVRGLALLISNGKPVIGISTEYKAVAASSIFGVPMLAVFLVVIIICSFVLAKTVYGRRVYACGGNLLAARVSGINTTKIRISTFAIAGLLAGLSGFLMTSRVTIGQPNAMRWTPLRPAWWAAYPCPAAWASPGASWWAACSSRSSPTAWTSWAFRPTGRRLSRAPSSSWRCCWISRARAKRTERVSRELPDALSVISYI